jgi:hypothetical protein
MDRRLWEHKKLPSPFLPRGAPNTKRIVVASKSYIEDARKWLDITVKPVWEN